MRLRTQGDCLPAPQLPCIVCAHKDAYNTHCIHYASMIRAPPPEGHHLPPNQLKGHPLPTRHQGSCCPTPPPEGQALPSHLATPPEGQTLLSHLATPPEGHPLPPHPLRASPYCPTLLEAHPTTPLQHKGHMPSYVCTFSPTIFMYVSTALVANVFPLKTRFSLSMRDTSDMTTSTKKSLASPVTSRIRRRVWAISSYK